MVVDSSALLAILLGAPEAPSLLAALVDAPHPRISVANWLEVAMVIEERGGRLASLRLDEFFRAASIELTPVDAAQAEAARTAWRYFGRHRHSARLNFSECFAYALAKSTGEPLLYRSEYYAESAQSIALSEIVRDKERPFIMSTPRLPDERTVFLETPFRNPALDDLFRMKREAASYGVIRDKLEIPAGAEPRFQSFFTETAPPPAPVYDGEEMRIRYLGHACVLIQAKGVSILVDPLVSYTYSSDLPRFTYEDLPEKIDYALITHSHHDHILLETLLQLRHKVKTVVVGRNLDGFLQDPSLQLALQQTGFPNVLEVRDMTEIPIPNGSITAIPFLGEHHDLLIQSKNAYLVRIGGGDSEDLAETVRIGFSSGRFQFHAVP